MTTGKTIALTQWTLEEIRLIFFKEKGKEGERDAERMLVREFVL